MLSDIVSSHSALLTRTMVAQESDIPIETQRVTEHACEHNGKSFVLVDTPGFDDTYRKKEDIVKVILDWLSTSFRSGKRLSGIIYLHRISDPRMQGSALSNFRMLQMLCGDNAFQNVVLVTSFWDMVDASIGKAREAELRNKEEFWAKMVRKGSKIERYNRNDPTSTDNILGIMERFLPCVLKAQKEVVIDGKDPLQTEAAAFARLAAMQATLEEEKRQAEKLKESLAEKAEEEKAGRRAMFEQQLNQANEARKRAEDERRKEAEREEIRRVRELEEYKELMRLETERQERKLRRLEEERRSEQKRMEQERRNARLRSHQIHLPLYLRLFPYRARRRRSYPSTKHPFMEKRKAGDDSIVERRSIYYNFTPEAPVI